MAAKVLKINVHAGHNPDGKIACGAVGLIKESTEARKVAAQVIKYLRTSGQIVYDCTVDNGTSQSDVLNKIVKKCNSHIVDLDVSIHFNSGVADKKGNGQTTGVEVLVYKLDKTLKTEPNKAADNIAKEIAKLGFKNRGVQGNTELYVLNSTKAPALLIECCFVDDKDDIKLYNYKKMARAIAVAILNSYGIQKYKTEKQISSFDAKGNKIRKIKKGESCNIDEFKFIKGYLMGHRRTAGEWVKVRYLTRK